MKANSPNRKRFYVLLSLFALLLTIGGVLGWRFSQPEVGEAEVVDTTPPAPTTAQINRILSGSLALVEAQHTFYTYRKSGERFAANVTELGFRSDQGAVQVSAVWKATTGATEQLTPLDGYVYQIALMTRNPAEKDGFVIAAFPFDEGSESPCFLSIVPNADGSIIGMSSRDTWEVKDPVATARIRSLFEKGKVGQVALNEWSPEKFPGTVTIKNFRRLE